jgi:hypothetical protein
MEVSLMRQQQLRELTALAVVEVGQVARQAQVRWVVLAAQVLLFLDYIRKVNDE